MKSKNRQKRRKKVAFNSQFIETTWAELYENARNLKNDPIAQAAWRKELDEDGYGVSFMGPFPTIWSKDIHISSILLKDNK